ncbi:DNA polymerase III subunit chi [Sessilibacter sp. MAH4]
MTHVDFYILQSSEPQARLQFVTRLAEKIFHARHQLVIATKDEQDAKSLSEQLWTDKPESFLAHALGETNPPPSEPIIVTHLEPHPHCHDVLINLTSGVLENHFSRFQRLVEVVCQDETVLQNTRKSFAFYRERGYPIKSHKINA